MKDGLHEKGASGAHLGWVGGMKRLRSCRDCGGWLRSIASGISERKGG